MTAPAATAPMPDRALYFVQISDTHLATRESYRRTQQVIDHINRLPFEIACVVHTGDIMDYNILDFSAWEDDSKFDSMFLKLIDGLELFYKG